MKLDRMNKMKRNASVLFIKPNVSKSMNKDVKTFVLEVKELRKLKALRRCTDE